MKINKTPRCERTRDSAQGLNVKLVFKHVFKNLISTNQCDLIKKPYRTYITFLFSIHKKKVDIFI